VSLRLLIDDGLVTCLKGSKEDPECLLPLGEEELYADADTPLAIELERDLCGFDFSQLPDNDRNQVQALLEDFAARIKKEYKDRTSFHSRQYEEFRAKLEEGAYLDNGTGEGLYIKIAPRDH
jgi:hypothetical protein